MVGNAKAIDYLLILSLVTLTLAVVYVPIMDTQWYAYLVLLTITLVLPTAYMWIRFPHVREVLDNPWWALWVFLLVMVFEYGGASIWWFHAGTTTAYFIAGILLEEWLFMFWGPFTCVVLYKAGSGK